MSDGEAFRLVDAENSGRSAFSAIEQARFYERAKLGYGSEAELAKALGLNKSTVNRTLDILRLPDDLTALIENEHAISITQASGFMANWREPQLHKTLAAAIERRAGILTTRLSPHWPKR